MQSLDEEKQRDAIGMAIRTIHEGNVPEDVRSTGEEVVTALMNIILYPLTSTQLGVFNNFLDLRKLDALKALDPRVRDFETKFQDIFVQEHQEIAQINRAIEGRNNLDLFVKNPRKNREALDQNFKDFLNLPKMEEKIDNLREILAPKLKQEGSHPLIKPPSGYIHRKLRENPRLVTGMANFFNVFGTLAAIGSIVKDTTGLQQGDVRDLLSDVATTIGAAGAIKGTYDLAKVLKHKLFGSKTTYFNGRRRPQVVPDRFQTVAQMLASEHGVNLKNMERVGNRFDRMKKTRPFARIFSGLGAVADGLFLGISIYDLYMDFMADSWDPWKIADDILFTTSAGIGGALGG